MCILLLREAVLVLVFCTPRYVFLHLYINIFLSLNIYIYMHYTTSLIQSIVFICTVYTRYSLIHLLTYCGVLVVKCILTLFTHGCLFLYIYKYFTIYIYIYIYTLHYVSYILCCIYLYVCILGIFDKCTYTMYCIHCFVFVGKCIIHCIH